MHSNTVRYIRNLFRSNGAIPLHTPRFIGNESNYVGNCIHSAEVSSKGEYVARFESMIQDFCGAPHAVAFNSGESALRVALTLLGTANGSEVITQALAYTGTANTIASCGAVPVFIDVQRANMGMDPARLKEYLAYNAEVRDDQCYNRHTQRHITACVPAHTLGFLCRIDEIKAVCDEYRIPLVEDASDAFGSLYRGKMAGRFGHIGIYGFEEDKIATCGDGGVLVCDDETLAREAKRLGDSPRLTAARNAPPGRFSNRMSNINAAVGCAQMEHIQSLVTKQRDLSRRYREFFEPTSESIFESEKGSEPNCWLNALVFEDSEARDRFLDETNAQGVNSRALWPVASDLEFFKACPATDLSNARWLQAHIAVIPSGVR